MTINPMLLNGKTIIVTGASSGIGRETAILLSKLNAKVVLISRNVSKLEEVLAELEGEGHRVVEYNLSNHDGIGEMIDKVVNKEGPLYGIAHCAGIQSTCPIRMVKYDKYKQIFDINFYAFFELIKSFSKKNNFDQEGGSIVAVSSVMGLKPSPGLSVYGASKAALDNLVKTSALELSSLRIRVNSVVPTYVNTDMFSRVKKMLSQEQYDKLVSSIPLSIGEPIDVANAIAFLLSSSAKWMTGSNMIVDGGYLVSK